MEVSKASGREAAVTAFTGTIGKLVPAESINNLLMAHPHKKQAGEEITGAAQDQ